MKRLDLTIDSSSIDIEGYANSFIRDSSPSGEYRADGWWGPTAEGKAVDDDGNSYTVIWRGAHYDDGEELQVKPGWDAPVIIAKDSEDFSYGQGNLLNDKDLEIKINWD